ncbi:hypothetical protein Naga_100827g3 [Nannochloropsis gaditana]|uniref:Uncharacterized protein n=1 Tax=Nannochloropsis gaditana TaxID=72520 RepID=W7TPE5_9STRA|nr:hypothetical protein Naga_100827g3 [Nannochloropsis gaditana]
MQVACDDIPSVASTSRARSSRVFTGAHSNSCRLHDSFMACSGATLAVKDLPRMYLAGGGRNVPPIMLTNMTSYMN